MREAENHRLEFTASGGDYFGDKLTHSFVAGGNLLWSWIPQLGLEAGYGYSQATADRTSLLGATLTNRDLHLLRAGFVVTKPAAFASGKKLVEADLYTNIGGGLVRFNGGNRGMGTIGGGLKTRFRKVPWFALDTAVRNFFFSIPNPGGSDFEYDLTLTIGLAFLFLPY